MGYEPNQSETDVGQHTNDEIESLIEQRLREQRVLLERELGIEKKEITHFQRPNERGFTRAEREHTTILFGGLTWKHEQLIHGALEGMGYKAAALATPDKKAFQLGREFGNNGQCNPTYFTVGNLVQHLQGLEEQGMTKDDIIDNYVFLTAGACGPCRFGMYEAEYRLALRNSGFDGFRVLLFSQNGGLDQEDEEGAGLELNMDFFFSILNAFNMGDLLNDVAYQIRPFEVNEGETDRVLQEGVDKLHDVLKEHKPFMMEGKVGKLLDKIPKVGSTAKYLGKFMNQLTSNEYTSALTEVGENFNNIELDRTRIKPIVKITGEFWAQTTEGDGNFNMFPFLEGEGAQVLVEPVGTWIMYMLHQAKQSVMDRKDIPESGHDQPNWWRLDQALSKYKDFKKKEAMLTAAEAIFHREWNRMRKALGNIPHDLTDQYELQRLGHPYYNSRAAGGEGHLEVAKNIYYTNKDLCHMVLSLKPFGCMPSTQSDGAQSAVINNYKDMIFLPIETSGEGDVNAHSRVQMAFGEAKNKAKKEFATTLESTGFTLERIKAYADEHPEINKPFYKIPHYKGIVGVGASFVRHVGELMKAEGAKAA